MKAPDNDKTGANCAVGQLNTNSSVFYLTGSGGGSVERTCTVPAGKGVLIMLASVEMSDKEVNPGTSVEELYKIAKEDQDAVKTITLILDNKIFNFNDLIKYRNQTRTFETVFPENALFGVTAGPSKVVSDNTFVITEPLPKGNHTVLIQGSQCKDQNCGEQMTGYMVKYKLVVG